MRHAEGANRMPHHVAREGTRSVGAMTMHYAVCTCGRSTTDSLSAESARIKVGDHSRGDNRGMV